MGWNSSPTLDKMTLDSSGKCSLFKIYNFKSILISHGLISHSSKSPWCPVYTAHVIFYLQVYCAFFSSSECLISFI